MHFLSNIATFHKCKIAFLLDPGEQKEPDYTVIGVIFMAL